jgi:hypothetical protein
VAQHCKGKANVIAVYGPHAGIPRVVWVVHSGTAVDSYVHVPIVHLSCSLVADHGVLLLRTLSLFDAIKCDVFQ